jgi:hypothetical protein
MPLSATKNEQPAQTSLWPGLSLALAVVLALRLWRITEAGLPDYDSVRNWQVVQELAQGNFAHLFHHGSPGFLLLYVPVAWLTRHFLVFQLLNAGLGVAGLGFFAGWVGRVARLAGWEAAGLTLLGGTSLLLTFSGRDFTMSSGSLVLLAGLLQSYYRRLQHPQPVALLRAAGWLAAGLCFNYKFLFALPILAVFELWRADGLLRQRGTWWRAGLILAAPYVLLSAVGLAVGLPWYRWLAFYVRTVLPVVANGAGRQGTLHLDLLYYPAYLLHYEPPLLLPGLVAALGLVLSRERPRPGQLLSPLAYLLGWAGCLLAGMSLLIKAPRGLLFAYLPLAALAVLSGRQLLPRWALAAALLAGIGLNGLRLQRELYARLPTHYPQVAAWLRAHQATRVASTVGLGLAPYLAPNQTLTTITDERQLAGLRRQGYQYVLLDAYWRVANIPHFDSLRRQPPLVAWPEPALTAPLLFLEHSEYSGLGYNATRAASVEAARDTRPLRLYRLQ